MTNEGRGKSEGMKSNTNDQATFFSLPGTYGELFERENKALPNDSKSDCGH